MENEWFTVKELYPNIWGIAELGHYEKVISYLFVGKRGCLLIDSGMGIENIYLQVKKITKLPITLINTHGHYDHVGGNKYFKNVRNPKNEEIINLYPFIFRIIITPGHTPDSICLYEQTKKLLIAGDTLYPGPIYLHLEESNIYDYINSLEKLNKITEIKNILPGHNSFKMNKKIIKLILNRIKRSNFIDNLIVDKNTTLKFK